MNEKLLSKPRLLQILFCGALSSCLIYFSYMFQLRRAVTVDVYMALNLLVPTILFFGVGLVINAWADKKGDTFISPIKIVLSICVLVAMSLILSAILARYQQAEILNSGSWLAFGSTIEDRNPRIDSIFGKTGFFLIAFILALLILFGHRWFGYNSKVTKPLLSLFTILAVIPVTAGILQLIIFGGNPRFMEAQNFVSIGLLDILNYVFVFLGLHILIPLHRKKNWKTGDFPTYLQWEKGNFRQWRVSGMGHKR